MHILALLILFLVVLDLALAYEFFPWRGKSKSVLHHWRVYRDKPHNVFVHDALKAQLKYEAEHAPRQHERLQKLGGMEGSRQVQHRRGVTLIRSHGHYDRDQRAASVEIRVRTAYRSCGQSPPKNLHELVEQAVK